MKSCVICRATESYRFLRYKEKNSIWDRYGTWDTRSYVCQSCYDLLRKYGTTDKDKIRENKYKYSKSRRDTYNKKKKCSRCGSTKTLVRYDGKEDWYGEYDDKKNWTGGYLCNKCYSSEYQERPDSQRSLMKDIADSRIGELSIYDSSGFGLIGEAVVAKVRKLDIISIKIDKFNARFDLSNDPEYCIIQVKIRSLQESLGSQIYEFWTLHISNYDFDHLFVLCVSFDMKNIERLYIIPRKEIDTMSLSIYKSGSKWKKFMVDENPYNRTYQSLMYFLGDKKYFGIEDIKKWMEL